MDKSKRYAVDGGYLINGAYVPHEHQDLARAGKAKALHTPDTVVGQRRQTKPSHAFAHGAPLDDEVCDKLCHAKGNVKTHPGMKQAYQGPVRLDGSILSHETPGESDAILREAGCLGRKV